MPTSHWPAAIAFEHEGVVRERLGGGVRDSRTRTTRLGGLQHAAHAADDHRDERLVVDRLAAAQAQLALPARIAEGGVGREIGGLHAAIAVTRSCGRARQRPETNGPRGQRIGARVSPPRASADLTGLQEACLRRAPEVAGIDRDEERPPGLPAPSAVSRWMSGAPPSVRRTSPRCRVIAAVLLEQLVHEPVLARGIDDEGAQPAAWAVAERRCLPGWLSAPGGTAGRCGCAHEVPHWRVNENDSH